MGQTIIERGPIGKLSNKPIYLQVMTVPDGEDYIPIWLLDLSLPPANSILASLYARFREPLITRSGHEIILDNSKKTFITGPDFPGPYDLGNQMRARWEENPIRPDIRQIRAVFSHFSQN